MVRACGVQLAEGVSLAVTFGGRAAAEGGPVDFARVIHWPIACVWQGGSELKIGGFEYFVWIIRIASSGTYSIAECTYHPPGIHGVGRRGSREDVLSHKPRIKSLRYGKSMIESPIIFRIDRNPKKLIENITCCILEEFFR